MRKPVYGCLLIGFIAICEMWLSRSASGAVPNSLVLNEVNTVSGGSFLDNGRGDTAVGIALVTRAGGETVSNTAE